MTIKEQISQLIENPGYYFESQTETGSYRLSPSEARILALLSQAYKMNKSSVLRRLIRQAAVEYEEGGEVLALLSYNHEGIK